MENDYVKGVIKGNLFIFKGVFFVEEEIYYVNIVFFIKIVNGISRINVE